jgi:hypothetical protein
MYLKGRAGIQTAPLRDSSRTLSGTVYAVATYTDIKLVDDLDGGPADETVQFSLDGRDYEIDLSTQHAQALRENLADYTEHARRAGKGDRPGRRRHSRDGRPNHAEAAAIRTWARENGYEVSGRGRIPKTVVEAYRAAA